MIAKRATIRWLSTDEGGRKTLPLGPRYIAPAKFLEHAENWQEEGWSLVVTKVKELGTPAQWLADVHFWAEQGPHDWLEAGGKFEIYEGRRRVAVGCIG